MKEFIKDIILSSISFYIGVVILVIISCVLLGPLFTDIFTKPTNNIEEENVIYDKGNKT